MIENLHFVFSGGGTPEHLEPGLAVAEQLLANTSDADDFNVAGSKTAFRFNPTRITFAGSGNPLQEHYVRAAGFEYITLRCRPGPRRPWDVFQYFVDHRAGFRAASGFLKKQDVSAVIGLGGYDSVPMARAAISRNVPLILLEQNAIPQRVTRWLAPFATTVCSTFRESLEYLPKTCPVRFTGNPLHEDYSFMRNIVKPYRQRHRRVLVLGGSNEAATMNQSVPKALYKVGAHLKNWEIVHQAGQGAGQGIVEAIQTMYRKLGLKAKVVSTIQNMSRVMTDSSLAICRGDGATLSRLAALCVPAIVVLPPKPDISERKNAEVLAAAGACLIVDERKVTGRFDNYLAAKVTELLADPDQCHRLSDAIGRLAQPDATQLVAATAAQLARRRNIRVAA